MLEILINIVPMIISVLLGIVLPISGYFISSFRMTRIQKKRQVNTPKNFDSMSFIEKIEEVDRVFNNLTSVYLDEKREKFFIQLNQTDNNGNMNRFSVDYSRYSDLLKIKTPTSQNKIAFKYIYSLYEHGTAIGDVPKKQWASLTNTEALTLRLLKEKAKSNTKTYRIGFVTFGIVSIYYSLTLILNLPEIDPFVLYFSAIYLLFCYLRQQVFEYRVRKGFFGTCYTEAKELVKFIIEHNSKNTSDKGKPVFIDEEPEAIALRILKGAKNLV